jgi:hypothetical protein
MGTRTKQARFRAEFDVREMYAGPRGASTAESVDPVSDDEALFRTRTGDPLLTMNVRRGRFMPVFA